MTGVALVFRDITDTLKVQEERAKASQLASLGVLAGSIAHDFNDILMVIAGNVSMARALSRTSPPARALVQAERACVRARDLTWQLLTFSRGGVPVKKTIALAPLLEQSAAAVLRGSQVTWTHDFAAGLASVQADEDQLRQVFSNILLNARQAMPHGGVIDIRAENIVEPSARWENALPVAIGRYVRVSIADRGVGIPREHLSRIFDPYFSTKRQGSGLGLSVAYAIVKNHGGYFSIDSALQQGTTIRVHLPAAPGAEAEDATPSTAPANTGRRILVLDDDTASRLLVANMLGLLGYAAETVDEAQTAVERFTRAQRDGQPFDVVMLDLVIPYGLGGAEVMARLSTIDGRVKGILMSGYARDETLTSFREHGFEAVLRKPFTLQELSTTLRSVMAVPRVH